MEKTKNKISGAGVVDAWNDERGFGFVISNDKLADGKRARVFVHVSAIEGEGFKTLDRGVPVAFEAVEGERGFKATSVRALPKAKNGTVKDVPQSRISPLAG